MSKTSNPLQSVTLALSNKGINNLFKTLTPALIGNGFTASSTSVLSSPVNIPSTDQRIDVNQITLSGGSINNIRVASTPSISYNMVRTQPTAAPTLMPCVSLGGALHVHYDSWYEQGSTFTEGATLPSSYSLECGAFDFDISNIDLAFNFLISGGTSASPLEWKVTVYNPQQSNVSVANVAVPSNSEIHGGDIHSCIAGRVDSIVDSKVADVNFAGKVADTLTGVLANIPDSGHLTSSIVYQFAPSCSPSYPAQDGIVLGITGAVQFNGSSYCASPVSIPLPAIQPDLDVSLNVAAYELNALLWAAYLNGDFALNLTPQSDSDSQTLNSAYYDVIWPALYNFGQSKSDGGLPLQVIIEVAEAPTLTIGVAFQLSKEVCAKLQPQVDTSTYDNLNRMVGIIYYSSSAFSEALSVYLTPAQVSQYGTVIVNAVVDAAGPPVLSAPLKVNAAFNYMFQGSWNPLLSFSLNRSNVLSNLSLSNPSGNADLLGFEFSQQNADSITDVNVLEPALDGAATLILDLVWALFSANLDIAIRAVGARGLPLPTFDGICLGSPSISLCVDSGGYISLSANIQNS
ncbi:hypothetical protein [Pseudomonas sp. Marseille-P9899]|uniref:hypothetical protein n=1 Tax=Pseudomonas sp. Marseille-P9899 TaxID=2730401 RepID=UPI00158EE153|nr:hypothetical protein [Pseudomonas sp. Marseille-P9899]